MDTPGIMDPTLYIVKAILILDNDGQRLLAKYYDSTFPTPKDQKAFEKNLFNKTHRANSEVVMLSGLTCLYRSNVDLYFYVIGSGQENELILVSVLTCLYETLNYLLRRNVEKRTLIDNMAGVMLAVDEICDNGIIVECDSIAVAQRITFRTEDSPLADQTVTSVISSIIQQFSDG